MSADYDLVIEDAIVPGRDGPADVALSGTEIAAIGPDPGAGERTIDADGGLVAPGFVDCHAHSDRAYAARGDRVPRRNDEQPSSLELPAGSSTAAFDAYYEEVSGEDVVRNALAEFEAMAAAGTSRVRSHVTVDHPCGTATMEALLEARERAADLVDVQLVPYAGTGLSGGETEALVREAIEMGLDAGGDPVLLGGVDPATREDDVGAALDRLFDLAAEYDVDLDLHAQEGGTLGAYVLDRLVEATEEYGYEGRVTASHAYALADLPDPWVDELAEAARDAGVSFVTCYTSTRCSMPIRALVEADVALGHGTDNTRDFVFPHGDPDPLSALRTLASKLHGAMEFDADYKWYQTNPGLAALWELITHRGASVLGVADDYGVAAGNPADLVVLDAPSPQWAICDADPPRYVVKAGTVVAADGDVTAEHRVVEDGS